MTHHQSHEENENQNNIHDSKNVFGYFDIRFDFS